MLFLAKIRRAPFDFAYSFLFFVKRVVPFLLLICNWDIFPANYFCGKGVIWLFLINFSPLQPCCYILFISQFKLIFPSSSSRRVKLAWYIWWIVGRVVCLVEGCGVVCVTMRCFPKSSVPKIAILYSFSVALDRYFFYIFFLGNFQYFFCPLQAVYLKVTIGIVWVIYFISFATLTLSLTTFLRY